LEKCNDIWGSRIREIMPASLRPERAVETDWWLSWWC
jgi:hypothetical protein